MADLSYLDAVILGVVEGLTEYLPVSSTGHLTITEQLLGLQVDDLAVTAYTAVIQLGAIAATLLYFFKDIVRFAVAWSRGLGSAEARKDPDYGLAWAVVIGSVPVGIVGFAARDLISGPLRSLWVVAAALVLWSVVMVVAERVHTRYESRGEVRGGAVNLRVNRVPREGHVAGQRLTVELCKVTGALCTRQGRRRHEIRLVGVRSIELERIRRLRIRLTCGA